MDSPSGVSESDSRALSRLQGAQPSRTCRSGTNSVPGDAALHAESQFIDLTNFSAKCDAMWSRGNLG
jgi:hypothetical protein